MKPDWSLPFRYVIGTLAFVAFVAFLFYAHEAVSALVIAAFSAYLISPVVSFLLERTRLSRAWAVNIVYFSALILLVGLPASLTPVFFNEAQLVVQDLMDLTTEANAALSQPVLLGPYEFHFEELGRSLTELQNTVLSPLPEELLQLLESTSIGVLWFLVIMVAVHLFLSHWPKMRDWLLGLAPVAYQDEARELYRRIRQVWMAYLRGQIVLMLIVGVVFTIAWAIIGIPGALVLGVVAGFFTLVPDVGPFLAAALAVGVALLEGSSWIPLPNFWVAGITLATYLVLINLKNFWLRPYVMGRSVHMNEGLVFIAIMAATILAGIMGALLVVPVLATVAVIGEYIRRRVLGLPAFDEGSEVQFVRPTEEPKSIRRRRKKAADKEEQK
ncbi:MAG: AI-2E family transporter [Anaerolineales bacterium]|nr:AI-2E family transporter [Anaerolineales bacterium]